MGEEPHSLATKKIKLLKKELLVSFQHIGFKYEPWSPIALVHTSLHHSLALNLYASLILLLSIMPFKLVSTSWSCIRINEYNAKKKNISEKEDKCLTTVCHFTFSCCEVIMREACQAKPATGLCSEGLSLIQREVWTLALFPGSSSLNPYVESSDRVTKSVKGWHWEKCFCL